MPPPSSSKAILGPHVYKIPAYSPCVSSFHRLRKIVVSDLVLGSHHRGAYLLLRTITPPKRLNALLAIAEDENKSWIFLALLHQAEENERAARDILDKGTVLIVKEPYFFMMSEGELGIRVDHVSDVVTLSEDDERIPSCWQPQITETDASVSVWKARGNKHFGESKYHSAIECYTRALNCSPAPEVAHTLRLNRALAFLKVKQFDAALSELESASTLQKPTEKALYRKSSALYGLQRYRECCEVLKGICLDYPNNVEARRELSRATNRLAEQQYGRYSFSKLYVELSQHRPPLLDHATYVGPICVKMSSESRGRGLFTTKAVKAGELLLCEKAFAYVSKKQEDSGATLSELKSDFGMKMEEWRGLTTTIVQTLYRNPSLVPVITDLYHGSYQPVDVSYVDGIPIVDTFLVKHVVDLNSFGCALSDQETYLCNEIDGWNNVVDQDQANLYGSGLWPMASYVNHSCNKNVSTATIGDMMILRATKDLGINTELTSWYQVPTGDNGDKREEMLKNWKFKCDCEMCKDHETTEKSVLKRRETLRDDFFDHLKDFQRSSLAKMETLLTRMADTYNRPASEVPQLSIYDLYLVLARVCIKHLEAEPAKVMDLTLKVLKSLGCVIEGGSLPRAGNPTKPLVIKQWGLMLGVCVECWLMLSVVYHYVAPELEEQAWEYARLSYKICTGQDETFEEKHRQWRQAMVGDAPRIVLS